MSLYYNLKRQLFPVSEGTQGFIPQFRLEGRSRNANDETGLEMRIADPLWMLGRQWQFGEFIGQDNGSPIGAMANIRKETVEFYSPSGVEERNPMGSVPLEAHIEAMEVRISDLRSKVRVGQKFERSIQAHFPKKEATNFIADLRVAFPLELPENCDERSRRYFNFMKDQVVDGERLWGQIVDNSFPKDSFEPLKSVVKGFKKWYLERYVVPQGKGSWRSLHLNHGFRVHGEGDFALDAPDYSSGHLDWHSFDEGKIALDPSEKAEDSAMYIPVRASYAAMPDRRLFSFEDSELELTGLEVDTSELVKLMFVDFSLVSENDWFIIPLKMALGELCWVNSVTVKDVFGVTTVIKNDKDTGQYLSADPLNMWDVFKIRPSNLLRERGATNQPLFKKEEQFLYLPPVTTFRQESRPLEELLFLRDEYANMVWAIEKTVCNAIGKPTNGYDLHLEVNGPFITAEEVDASHKNTLPRFRLASTVPTNWIPYLPFHSDGSNIELHRAMMMRNEAGTEPQDIEPLSILARTDLLAIREEAIPRSGVRVQLTRQRVRGTDGKTYIWQGRNVRAGKGEGSSGLTFDQLIF